MGGVRPAQVPVAQHACDQGAVARLVSLVFRRFRSWLRAVLLRQRRDEPAQPIALLRAKPDDVPHEFADGSAR